MFRKYKTPEKVKGDKILYANPDRNNNNYCIENYGNKDDTSSLNKGRKKHRKKDYVRDLVNKSSNESMVYIKENNEQFREIDLVINFELRNKKSNYIEAYYTESDLNKRKMYHELKHYKNVLPIARNLDVEVSRDDENDGNCTAFSKNCSSNISRKKIKKSKVKQIKEEFDEQFNHNCEMNSHENYPTKDVDKYFTLPPSHAKKRKKCFYDLSEDKRSTYGSPHVYYSDIDLLFNNYDKYKINKSKSKKNSNDRDYTNNFNDFTSNFVDDSIGNEYLLEEVVNVTASNGSKKTPKNTIVNLKTAVKSKNYFSTDDSHTNEKCVCFSNHRVSTPDDANVSLRLNTSAFSISLKDIYCDFDSSNSNKNNVIFQNPEKLEDGKSNERSICTSCDICFYNAHFNSGKEISNSTLLDYSISQMPKDKSQGMSRKMSDIPLKCNFFDYTSDKKKCYESGRNSRKTSRELFLNRIKNKYGHKKLNKILTDAKNKYSLCNVNNFDKNFRNYLTDRSLREYYFRKKLYRNCSDTQSEFIPCKLNYIKHEVNRPHSIEKDILLKNCDEAVNHSLKSCNCNLPFYKLNTMESELNRKIFVNEEISPLSDILSSDDVYLKQKQNNERLLNYQGQNTSIVQEKENIIVLANNTKINKDIKEQNMQSNFTKKQVNNHDRNGYNSVKTPLHISKDHENDKNNPIHSQNDKIRTAPVNVGEEKHEIKEPQEIVVLLDHKLSDHQKVKIEIPEQDRKLAQKVQEIHKEESNGKLFHGKNYENMQNLKKYKSIEVILPARSNRIFCQSQATLITNKSTISSSDSLKVRLCKSDRSQKVEKNEVTKIISEKNSDNDKKMNGEENQNAVLSDNNIEMKKKSGSEVQKQEQDLVRCLDLITCSKFRLEVEKIIKNYLEKNVLINWVSNNRYDIIIIPKDDIIKSNPRSIVDMIKRKQVQGATKKNKKYFYKFRKVHFSHKSLRKNRSIKEDVNCDKIIKVNKNIRQNIIPCKSEEVRKINFRKSDLSNTNKIRSLPVFNESKLKIQKHTITYSLLTKPISKINNQKSIMKSETDKVKCRKNKSDIDNSMQKNHSKNKINNVEFEEEKGSEIFEELSEFKKLLTEVEKKQDSILNILNHDPCGMSFHFPSSTTAVKNSKKGQCKIKSSATFIIKSSSGNKSVVRKSNKNSCRDNKK